MNGDLFGPSGQIERLGAADADLTFIHGFYEPQACACLMQRLLNETPWCQESITVWGREYLQPRLSAWHGDENSGYAYSGLSLRLNPWTPTLRQIRADIERRTQCRFNSVLLNQYRNERDGVGWHSDNERELGPMPVIASLSFGATRAFRLRHKKNAHRPIAIDLTDGSLLIMAGATQRCWRHAILKESLPKGPRINLTFRTIFRHDARPDAPLAYSGRGAEGGV